MGNQNATSKRMIAGDFKTDKLKSAKAYGSSEPGLKYRGRSQTPTATATRKSKRKFVLDNRDRGEDHRNQDQSYSESDIKYSKRSFQGKEIDLERRKEYPKQSQQTKEERSERGGRRNIFQPSKCPSESQATISTTSSTMNNTTDGGITKSQLAALQIPENIKEINEQARKEIMSEIYIQEFRAPDVGVIYYIDKKWLDKWIHYMKDGLNQVPKPTEITNMKISHMLEHRIEINPNKDAYCLSKRIWAMLQYVYGGGPEAREGKESGRSSPSEKYMSKSQRSKTQEPELYEKHQIGNIPSYPSKFSKGKGIVGFFNNYLYCYLNACLQMLMTITPLRDFLVNQTYQECQHIARMSGRADSPQHMCFAMAKTYYNVWSYKSTSQGYEPVLRTSEIQSQLRGTFSPMNENDCHEALLFILSRLQEEMTPRKKKYSLEDKSIQEAWKTYRAFNPSIIDQLFCGLLRSTVTCGGCGYESRTYDPFYDLSLPIKGIRGDIYTCIDRFLSEERFQKKMYDCEKCRKRNKATKKFDLVKLPKYLMVVFKRFSGITSKIKSTISFPIDLDLSGMLTKGNISEYKKYSLVSMMEHLGSSARSGHYVGFFKRGEKWYEADDERIRAISTRQLLREEAYVLLYEALD